MRPTRHTGASPVPRAVTGGFAVPPEPCPTRDGAQDPVLVEVGPGGRLVVVRSGAQESVAFGLDPGTATRVADALRRPAGSVFTALHPEVVVASLLIEPASTGAVATLTGDGRVLWSARMPTERVELLAALLRRGAAAALGGDPEAGGPGSGSSPASRAVGQA
ncbi:hypothetical protein [Actinoalloteichus caeruleus]|uniref:hypothetical protein n=1 Tax=Actinoalloteichus cyanogriseus TaxID=2893586 RepID=UPI0004AA7242|nr:hypothetical protein [Actinoalloteichus caeruleus]